MAVRNVLLIDRDADTLHIYRTALELNGFGVRQARSGQEALEVLRQFDADVVVQELEIGTMSGIELIRSIRGGVRRKDIPILIVSAQVGTRAQDDAVVAGCSSFLAKPCRPSEMLAEVQRLVGSA